MAVTMRACVETDRHTRMVFRIPIDMPALDFRDLIRQRHHRLFPSLGNLSVKNSMVLIAGNWYSFDDGEIGGLADGADGMFKIELSEQEEEVVDPSPFETPVNRQRRIWGRRALERARTSDDVLDRMQLFMDNVERSWPHLLAPPVDLAQNEAGVGSALEPPKADEQDLVEAIPAVRVAGNNTLDTELVGVSEPVVAGADKEIDKVEEKLISIQEPLEDRTGGAGLETGSGSGESSKERSSSDESEASAVKEKEPGSVKHDSNVDEDEKGRTEENVANGEAGQDATASLVLNILLGSSGGANDDKKSSEKVSEDMDEIATGKDGTEHGSKADNLLGKRKQEALDDVPQKKSRVDAITAELETEETAESDDGDEEEESNDEENFGQKDGSELQQMNSEPALDNLCANIITQHFSSEECGDDTSKPSSLQEEKEMETVVMDGGPPESTQLGTKETDATEGGTDSEDEDEAEAKVSNKGSTESEDEDEGEEMEPSPACIKEPAPPQLEKKEMEVTNGGTKSGSLSSDSEHEDEGEQPAPPQEETKVTSGVTQRRSFLNTDSESEDEDEGEAMEPSPGSIGNKETKATSAGSDSEDEKETEQSPVKATALESDEEGDEDEDTQNRGKPSQVGKLNTVARKATNGANKSETSDSASNDDDESDTASDKAKSARAFSRESYLANRGCETSSEGEGGVEKNETTLRKPTRKLVLKTPQSCQNTGQKDKQAVDATKQNRIKIKKPSSQEKQDLPSEQIDKQAVDAQPKAAEGGTTQNRIKTNYLEKQDLRSGQKDKQAVDAQAKAVEGGNRIKIKEPSSLEKQHLPKPKASNRSKEDGQAGKCVTDSQVEDLDSDDSASDGEEADTDSGSDFEKEATYKNALKPTTGITPRRNPRRTSLDSRLQEFVDKSDGLDSLFSARKLAQSAREPPPAVIPEPPAEVIPETQDIEQSLPEVTKQTEVAVKTPATSSQAAPPPVTTARQASPAPPPVTTARQASPAPPPVTTAPQASPAPATVTTGREASPVPPAVTTARQASPAPPAATREASPAPSTVKIKQASPAPPPVASQQASPAPLPRQASPAPPPVTSRQASPAPQATVSSRKRPAPVNPSRATKSSKRVAKSKDEKQTPSRAAVPPPIPAPSPTPASTPAPSRAPSRTSAPLVVTPLKERMLPKVRVVKEGREPVACPSCGRMYTGKTGAYWHHKRICESRIFGV